jgi:hypothetical protein
MCSKKDQEVRRSELLDAVSDPLLEDVANDAESWISKSSIGMVTLAVLKSGKGERMEVLIGWCFVRFSIFTLGKRLYPVLEPDISSLSS